MIHGRGSSSTYAPFGIREASATFVEDGAPGERHGAFPPLVQLGAAIGRHRRRGQARRIAAATDIALAATFVAVLLAAGLAIFRAGVL